MQQRIDWWSFAASQVIFGLVAGYVVTKLGKIKRLQQVPLAVRLGVETPGLRPDRDGEERTVMKTSAAAGAGALVLFALAGCNLPGKPKAGPEVPRPEEVLAFETLYGANCAGCHGANGQNGAATNLANPEYQALIDDASLREVIAKGRREH